MASWSSRRKFSYGLLVFISIILFIGLPSFLLFYKAPTCFDNKQNGGEFGIDCGGKCQRLCQNAFIPPEVGWSGAKFEKISDGLYNVASYIINPNLNGASINTPYKISLFDDKGNLITERSGEMTIPAHRNTLAFESSVNVGSRIPVKAIFEFTKAPEWFKSHDNLDGLIISNKQYNEEGSGSSLNVTFENRTLFLYKDIDIYVILYDVNGNAIGFSKTKIDSILPKNGKEIASFTWPLNRNKKVTSIEIIPIITPPKD